MSYKVNACFLWLFFLAAAIACEKPDNKTPDQKSTDKKQQDTSANKSTPGEGDAAQVDEAQVDEAQATVSDLVGKQISFDNLAWLNLPGNRAPPLSGKATLVRWWTDGCRYCATSLPAIEQLRERFANRGLQTLAVYHPKPPRNVPPDQVLQAAKNIGYTGWVASDLQWKVLMNLAPDLHRRRSTSMTFLVDPKGIIRFVHRCPVFGPGNDPSQKDSNRDYLDIVRAVEDLLAEL